jgi:hypothetical protein
MDSPEARPRTTQKSLEVVQRNDLTTIETGGVPLLDGRARDGRIYLRFTENSGVRAEFEITGPATTTEIHFFGVGTVHIGGLEFRDAWVDVTADRLGITAPVKWANYATKLRLQEGDSRGTWRGDMDGRETLPCLVTKQEALRASVSLVFDAHRRRSTYTVLAVLEGRNIEVADECALDETIDKLVSNTRHKTLAAVRSFLANELALWEEKLAAAQSDDDPEIRGYSGRSADSPLASTVGAGDSAATARRQDVVAVSARAGYLPLRSIDSDSAVSRTRPMAGYLDNRYASRATSGYLSVSPTVRALPLPDNQRMPSGYLPDRRRPVLTGLGYLPAISPGRRPQTWPRAAVPSTNRELPQHSAAALHEREVTTLVDFERVAYAVLRCKDLLHAVDAARAQGVDA